MKGLMGTGCQLMKVNRQAFQQKRMASLMSVETVKSWGPTAALFGCTGFITLLYFTDWRVFTDYIPFYNGKYKKRLEDVELTSTRQHQNKIKILKII